MSWALSYLIEELATLLLLQEIKGLFIILLYDRKTERKVDVLGLICVIEELATLLLYREIKAKKVQSLEH